MLILQGPENTVSISSRDLPFVSVRGTASQLIQDQKNRHKGRRLLKKMKNMQNDQKIHLQIAIHTDLALELQQPIL
jgi:hypothetical protein